MAQNAQWRYKGKRTRGPSGELESEGKQQKTDEGEEEDEAKEDAAMQPVQGQKRHTSKEIYQLSEDVMNVLIKNSAKAQHGNERGARLFVYGLDGSCSDDTS